MTGTVGIKADFLTSKHKRDIERIALSNNLKLHYFTDTADMDAVIGQCEILYGYIPPKAAAGSVPALAGLRFLRRGQYLGEYLLCRPRRDPDQLRRRIRHHHQRTYHHHSADALRRIPGYYDVGHEHQRKDLGRISSIYGSVITVVGTGDIGTAFAQRAKALGAAHIRGVHRTNKVLPRCFDELRCGGSDFALAGATLWCSAFPAPRRLSIHYPGAAGPAEKTSVLINVGRGSVLDQDALMEVLNSGKIAGAALDVTNPEPLPPEHPLWNTKI